MALKSQGILYEVLFLLIGKQEKKNELRRDRSSKQEKNKRLISLHALDHHWGSVVKGGFLLFRVYCRSFLLGPQGQRWFWILLTTLLNVMNEAVYLAHPLRQGAVRVCFPVI